MSRSLKALDPDFRPYAEFLFESAAEAGLRPRITSTRRSRAEQTRLYRRWLEGKNPFPVAIPGTSVHEVGQAIDLVCDDLQLLGEWWVSLGGRWSPRDAVHFQL